MSRLYTSGDRLLRVVGTGANWRSPAPSKAHGFSPSLPCRDADSALPEPLVFKETRYPNVQMQSPGIVVFSFFNVGI